MKFQVKYLWVSLLTFMFGLLFVLKNPVFLMKNEDFGNAKPDVDNIKSHVKKICEISPTRNWKNEAELKSVGKYIYDSLKAWGYNPSYKRIESEKGEYYNVYARLENTSNRLIVLGSHYDAYENSPGADDNASGVAAILEVARLLKLSGTKDDNVAVEFAFYALEEPPMFNTASMGSLQHAESLKKKYEKIALMMSVESVGYYSGMNGSQKYDPSFLKWFFPTKGNYISISGNISTWFLARKVKKMFMEGSNIPAISFNGPESLFRGISSSDHMSFSKVGLPALMVTDTAFYRNPHYHTPSDTTETLNYEKIGEVVRGLINIVDNF